MPNTQPTGPLGGRLQYLEIPAKVHRRTLSRPVYKRQSCTDNRAYTTVPFTVAGPLAVVKYGPEWHADRDYWIARLTLEIGRHDSGTHPAGDGTPGGRQVNANMIRVKADQSSEAGILNSNSRLHVSANNHRDSVNDGEAGAFVSGDFNIHHLNEGDRIYPQFFQVGSTRPGTLAVISIVLVPIP
jgi:hypothetical protein